MLNEQQYIERIIKSYRDNPNRWSFVGLSADAYRTLCTAYNATANIDTDELLKNTGDEVMKQCMIAQAAILCLMMYEDCGYMLAADLNEIRLLRNLGDKRAILMYHACRIMKISRRL